MYILVLLTVSNGALLSDEMLSQRFLQLRMFRILLYILVLPTVCGAFQVDEMLSWCSLQPVYVQDAVVYTAPADGIWGAPVGWGPAPALPPAVYVHNTAVNPGPADGISFLEDEMLSWCSLQLVQDASVYSGPADGTWDAPVR